MMEQIVQLLSWGSQGVCVCVYIVLLFLVGLSVFILFFASYFFFLPYGILPQLAHKRRSGVVEFMLLLIGLHTMFAKISPSQVAPILFLLL